MELKTNSFVKRIGRLPFGGALVAGIIFGNFIILPATALAQANVSLSKQSDQPGNDFCADPSFGTRPCPILPADIAEFDASFIYRFVGPESQRPFDRFSWQSFIAMTWPVGTNGRAVSYPDAAHPDDSTRPRWQRLVTRDALIRGENATGDMTKGLSVCREAKQTNPASGHLENAGSDGMLLYAYRQATGDVLVDQAGNYVLYQTRLNDVAVNYIRRNQLATFAGRARQADLGSEISFPMQGNVFSATADTHNMAPGATLLKFAWRVLTVKDDSARFLTRKARLFVPARDSLSGRPMCQTVVVGLIGLHLVQRVVSGNGDRWIWSTFEHGANAPLAGNARRPNSFIAQKLFPDGCRAPAAQNMNDLQAGQNKDIASSQQFNLFDPTVNEALLDAANTPNDVMPKPDSASLPNAARGAAQGAIANQAFVGRGRAMWAQQPPYAVDRTGQAIARSQIVRCWRVFEGTAQTNARWHQALAGSVWENYFLVGTQWIGNGGGVPFGVGEVPRFLSNVALESFIQHQETGTCLGCHSTARSDAGQLSNFTFVLAPAN
ncbi:hypothetical protein [Thalassospira mesophila]|uniref:hypothetical protein n=1 Tax=Thalassospira mesophila TaxID=1293891 RepID=UPI000A1DB1F0|nr:hypothetical protein [Thalassospira mesophila]